MKARLNKSLDFDRSFIDTAIADGKGMSELASELKTSAYFIEKRIFMLFENDSNSRLDALYGNDHVETRRNDDKKAVNICTPPVAQPEQIIPEKHISPTSVPLGAVGHLEVFEQVDSEDTDDFLSFLAANLEEGLAYALRQMEADDAVGESYAEVDTTATRAAIKKLESEISAAEKTVSERTSRLTEAELEKTKLDERVERATEKLRRAKLDAGRAAGEVDSAKTQLKFAKAKLESLRKQKTEMQRELDSIQLPSFSVVPSGDCVVLKAINYDTRKMDSLEAALKWSRRIGEKFSDLTDSEFAVMGRLFGILSKLKGKFRIEFDPSLTKVISVWDEFKGCFQS